MPCCKMKDFESIVVPMTLGPKKVVVIQPRIIKEQPVIPVVVKEKILCPRVPKVLQKGPVVDKESQVLNHREVIRLEKARQERKNRMKRRKML